MRILHKAQVENVKLLKGIHTTLAFTKKKKQTNKSVTEAV